MLDVLEKELCAAFCGSLQVHPVPSGMAVSSIFEDSSGDRLSFYISETPDGFQIEDDGSFLADLIARDIPIDTGARGDLLNAILQEGGAYWDADTFEIKTEAFPRDEIASRAIPFLSSLIRVRDLALISRERVRSAFREDFIREVTRRFGDGVDIQENVAPANDLAEFPADVVLTKQDAKKGAIYLVNSSDKLNEALLAWIELEKRRSDIALVAVMEDSDFRGVSRKRFQRAQNRRLPMPFFRGDEEATLEFIRQAMEQPVAA